MIVVTSISIVPLLHYEFSVVCDSTSDIVVVDRAKYGELLSYINNRSGGRPTGEIARQLGFSVDDKSYRLHVPLGVRRYRIPIRYQGRAIAYVNSATLNTPNMLAIFLVDSPEKDDDCAYGHPQKYPAVWSLLK